jgi:toxin YhaV
MVVLIARALGVRCARRWGSKTAAYATFKSMLESGNRPDNFSALLKTAKASAKRLEAAVKAATDG